MDIIHSSAIYHIRHFAFLFASFPEFFFPILEMETAEKAVGSWRPNVDRWAVSYPTSMFLLPWKFMTNVSLLLCQFSLLPPFQLAVFPCLCPFICRYLRLSLLSPYRLRRHFSYLQATLYKRVNESLFPSFVPLVGWFARHAVRNHTKRYLITKPDD